MAIEIPPGLIISFIIGALIVFFIGFVKKELHKKCLNFYKLVWQKGFAATNQQHQFIKPTLFRDPPTDIMPQNPFPLLKKRRGIVTFLSKKNNAYLFNYTYTTGHGKNSRTHAHFCYLSQLDKTLPGLEIRPETFFDRLIKPLYSKDIPIHADADWSKRYLVTGSNESVVQDVISQRFRERFQSKYYSLATTGDRFLMTFDKTRHNKTEDMLQFIDDAIAIERMFEGK